MIFLRCISFCVLVGIGFFLPMWVFIFTVLFYSLLFGPYEVLILAVCIDAQFGNAEGVWYLYTVFTSGVTLAIVFIRPYVRMRHM